MPVIPRPRPPRRATVRLAVAGVVLSSLWGCGGELERERDARPVVQRSAEPVARPPSAAAPRASLPGRSPDTMRATGDVRPVDPDSIPVPSEPLRSPEEFDLAAIVERYRRYYIEGFHERGSSVHGGTDPELESRARRRVARDWEYEGLEGWSHLLRDLTRDQRIVLADRIQATNRDLARGLHDAASPGGSERR